MFGHCQKPLCSPRPLGRVETNPGWCFWVVWRESAVYLEKLITRQDNQPSHTLPRKRCFHQVLLMPPLCWLTVLAASHSLVVLAAAPASALPDCLCCHLGTVLLYLPKPFGMWLMQITPNHVLLHCGFIVSFSSLCLGSNSCG